jgi:peptide/nickel transport system substrate-binding protein
VRVRKALKMVIDRQKMVDTVLLGQGEVGNDNPIQVSSPDAYTDQAPEQDIEGAKQLLADAGYDESKPLKVDFYTSEYIPGAVNLANLYKQMAAEAGIEINVVVGPAGEHWDNVWLKQPFVGSGWAARPPAEALSTVYLPNSEGNETHWKRADYAKLIKKAAATLDADERTELQKQAQKQLAEEGGVIIPAFFKTLAAVNKDCGGYEPHRQSIQFDFTRVACK